jgi:hypothetical protein
VGKRERKRTLVRPERRREDNFKIDLKKMRWEWRWIDLVQ